jgi:hypothetical protein
MSKPAHKIRIGVLQATIWRNSGDNGTWYSVLPSRSYKQGDETWKETDSLNFDDLLPMAKLLDLAHLGHAPATGRRESSQRIRSGSRLTRVPVGGFPPAGFFSTIQINGDTL